MRHPAPRNSKSLKVKPMRNSSSRLIKALVSWTSCWTFSRRWASRRHHGRFRDGELEFYSGAVRKGERGDNEIKCRNTMILRTDHLLQPFLPKVPSRPKS